MTILAVLFLTVVSTCLVQSASSDAAKQRAPRAPQSQILYSDPDGSKVDWKLYAPQNQWRSHLESTQRLQRGDKRPSKANFSPKQQATVINPPVQAEPHYQPYSSVPEHIKKLIIESYDHQGPHVDPGAFFYQAYAPISVSMQDSRGKDDQHPRSETRQREYFDSLASYRTSGYSENNDRTSVGQIGKVPQRGGIKYKDEERSIERSTTLPYGSVIGAQSRQKTQHHHPYGQISHSQSSQYEKRYSDAQSDYSQYDKRVSEPAQYNRQIYQPQQQKSLDSFKPVYHGDFQKNMPMAIQQLLRYQAQLPYNVIANHIVYRPKQLFIPKPLPESVKHSKQYPSKVYFLKTDGQIYDSPEIINGENKHGERF